MNKTSDAAEEKKMKECIDIALHSEEKHQQDTVSKHVEILKPKKQKKLHKKKKNSKKEKKQKYQEKDSKKAKKQSEKKLKKWKKSDKLNLI